MFRAILSVLTLLFVSPLLAQAPDGLYDMDVLNANPHLIQRFPGEVSPGNRTIIIVGESGGVRNVSGAPIPTQYQGNLLDFDAPVSDSNIEVDRRESFEEASKRVKKREPKGPSFSDVAIEVKRRGRFDLESPTSSRRVRNIQLYDF